MVLAKHQFMVDELSRLREVGLYNKIKTIQSPQGAWLRIDDKKVLNMCSNNYLGLANHPVLVDEAKRILDEFGIGPGAVRSIAGTMSLHNDLERLLAEFKNDNIINMTGKDIKILNLSLLKDISRRG